MDVGECRENQLPNPDNLGPNFQHGAPKAISKKLRSHFFFLDIILNMKIKRFNYLIRIVRVENFYNPTY